MCIIVYAPEGVKLPPRATLETCYNNNPDGCGFMKRDENGKVSTFKGIYNFSEFYAEVLENDDINASVALHFRIKTQGDINAANCHPFEAKPDNWLMHNGTFYGFGFDDLTRTDSEQMGQLLARIAPADISESVAADKVLNLALEWGAALVFDPSGITQAGEWVEDGGVFYSNSSYKPADWDAWKFGDYTRPDIAPKFKACNSCPYLEDCEEWGAFCRNEKEAYNTIKTEMMGLAV